MESEPLQAKRMARLGTETAFRVLMRRKRNERRLIFTFCTSTEKKKMGPRLHFDKWGFRTLCGLLILDHATKPTLRSSAFGI
jgi:hypothetical protein